LKTIILSILLLLSEHVCAQSIQREYRVTHQYLNIPVEMKQNRQKVYFLSGHDTLTHAVIRIAGGKPDYWVFKDVSAHKGKSLILSCATSVSGLDMIYQSDRFAGEDSLYREARRPQFHFSSRRGWNNDPNGLVYFDGEYHLFYQHNPYETEWGNMHWGHAVSPDVLHWTELDDALYPDRLGTMFSGSAVIDHNNTAGWGKNTLVAVYTTDGKGEFQCLAYSRDKGRTFAKYEGNPVVGETRDPKVIWYEPAREWVMALFKNAGISFFASQNLKQWQETGHVIGFFECPELFELAVDGHSDHKLWVLYSGSGTYMLGDFDGRKFRPRYGKYRTTCGAQYAAQTYNNTPDGRRIQIGWGRIEAKGMPFNQMMCFPTELTLRTTNEGVRLFSEPIAAIEKLHRKAYHLSGLSVAEANEKLRTIDHDLLHVIARLESTDGRRMALEYQGNRCIVMDSDEINGVQTPQTIPGSMIFDVELLIDRTSLESYLQRGLIVFVDPLKPPLKPGGLEIVGKQEAIRIHKLDVFELNSIWP
jgi:sucrose-6-phosphate hydrolase SacC (GH32 family)